MKTAITVSTEAAYPKALVVFRGLEESVPIIADLGYDGIELAVWRKDVVDAGALRKLLARHRLEVPVVSTGQIFTLEEVWLTHPDETVRQRAVVLLEGIIELAAEFGADVNISRVRGYIHDEDTEEEALRRLGDGLTSLSRYAESRGPKLLLEQMNMFETNFLHSVKDVGDYIRTLGLPNVRIHADTFHMNIHDVDMPGVLAEYSDILGYVHFSDSNRLAPGSGHIDFPAIVRSLEQSGYEGWGGIEIFPEPSGEEAARDAINYLRSIYRGA